MASAKQQQQEAADDSVGGTAPGVTAPKPTAMGTSAAKSDGDGGPAILSDMENFVQLMRKAKSVALVRRLLNNEGVTLPAEFALPIDKAKGALPPAARKALFNLVAATASNTRSRLEHAAERIVLLDDEYGKQAVLSLLDANDANDAPVLARHDDSYGRALYLFLEQEYSEADRDRNTRFDNAERVQVMNRQWKSEAYSSHYQGPKGATPIVDAKAKQTLTQQVLALYPQAPADAVIVEHFTRRDLSHARRHGDAEDEDGEANVLLHTITVTFNGSEAHYRKVEDGEVVAHDDLAALSIRFSFEPTSGALSVFSDDREVRRDLAKMFRETVLAEGGDITNLPIREFSLSAFASEAMLKRLTVDKLDQVERIDIIHLKIADAENRRFTNGGRNGRTTERRITNYLAVQRDKFEDRNIYAVARTTFKMKDLTPFNVVQVTLSIRVARQPNRKAHNIVVQITVPHGLNDRTKTEDDRKLVMAQLVRLGILQEF